MHVVVYIGFLEPYLLFCQIYMHYMHFILFAPGFCRVGIRLKIRFNAFLHFTICMIGSIISKEIRITIIQEKRQIVDE